MKKSTLTEDKAEQTPTGGVLVGKRKGQTIIHNKGTLSGYLVGKTHAEGGIKAVNKSTGQPLEMQGGEVVITAPAVSDQTKNNFNGKMMTNREILSQINVNGGGVAFAKGGDIPKDIKRTGASYKYGGKTMTDHEIYKRITGGHLAEGMTLPQIAKMHKVSVKELQKQVDMGMKAESEHTSSKREQMKIVKDHLYENPKYYTLLKKAGLKHGGRVHRGSLVRDTKSGNTPARDLNNYNDVLDLDADGMVGAETGLYAKGGIVITSVKDIPNFEQRLNERKVSYRGLGAGKLSNDFYELAGENGTRIKVDGKEYFITETEFNKFSRDSNGRLRVRFEAPERKYNGGSVKPYDANMEGDSADMIFDTGGGVKEVVEYITIGNYSENPYNDDDKIKFYNFIDFKNYIKDIYANEGITNKRLIYLCVNNDDSFSESNINVSQGKNTNKNFNPFTGSFDAFFKNINDKIVATKYDWNRWGGVKTSASTPSQTSKPIDLMNKKIWVKGNPDLSRRVQELGFANGFVNSAGKTVTGTQNGNIYFATRLSGSGDKYMYILDYDKDAFDNELEKEVFESDLFPTASATLTEIPDVDFNFSGRIKDLPEKIKQLALQSQVDAGNSPNDDLLITTAKQDGNFTWEDTGEGTDFWLQISTGRFESFKKIYGDYGEGLNVINLSATPTSTTGKFTVDEIDLFNQIDIIVKTNNIKSVDMIGWRKSFGSKDFIVISKLTGAVYSLRSFNDKLGTQVDDINRDSATALIKDYLEFEKSTPTSTTKTTSAPITDLSSTKIWVKGNPDLSRRVQELAFANGFKFENNNPTTPQDLTKNALFFFRNLEIMSAYITKQIFDENPLTEIFESDLFGTTPSQTSTQNAPEEDWAKKFTADLDKLVFAQGDLESFPELSKEEKDLENLKKLLPSFQQKKYAIERAKILKEIKRLHKKLTYEGFIKGNEGVSSDADLFTPQGLLDYYYTQATQNPTADLEPACELPTPNGEKSKLPLSAYLNVRTSQFKNWFGDWEKAYETGNYVNCSKMIDPDTKEPKIYFHGVRKYVPNFGQFSNMGQGVVRPYGAFEPPTFPASYFAGEEDYAKFYGGIAENMPTPSLDYKPFIYKVFLSVKNPISLLPLDFMLSYKDFMDYIYVGYGVKVTPNQELLRVLDNDLTKKNPMWIYVRRDIGLIEMLKDLGYDALFQMGDIPTFLPNGEVEPDRTKHLQEVEYLTFYPNQVKSATVKKSFYFDFFNDIRFKNGGYVRI